MQLLFDFIKTKFIIMANKKKTNSKSKAKESNNPCWDRYKKVGMKIKKGKNVPNCVPEK